MFKIGGLPTHSIISRLLLSFIVITMPIYLLGIGLYSWAQGIVKNEITNSALSNVTSYLSDLENEFLRIKSLQNDCVIDQNLNMISYRYEVLSNYDWTMAIIGLGHRLRAIKESSTYIDDICVYIKPINRMISAIRGFNTMDGEYYAGIALLCRPVPQFIYWGDTIR